MYVKIGPISQELKRFAKILEEKYGQVYTVICSRNPARSMIRTPGEETMGGEIVIFTREFRKNIRKEIQDIVRQINTDDASNAIVVYNVYGSNLKEDDLFLCISGDQYYRVYYIEFAVQHVSYARDSKEEKVEHEDELL
jgi:hypothetical protein